MMRALPSRLLALCAALGFALAATLYPFNPPLLAALAAYAVLLWLRPTWWLLVVPAVLPVFDLAPYNGWFYLEELDLLLLLSAAIGYWRLAPPQAELPPFAVFALWLSALAAAVSAWIGLLPLPPLDANAFANYSSHYNSLRVAKGLAWALLLLPLLRRSVGADLGGLRRLFVPGMLLGLAGATLAVVWERTLFPGLLNFASDYRPTAPFSAMHTGGAALDAYLAAAFPFVTLWLIGSGSRRQLALALPLLVMGFFTGFTTFSRDVFLAYGCSGAILVLMVLGNQLRRGALRATGLSGAAVLLAVTAYVLLHVFHSSGYRGMAAALLLLGAAVLVAGAPQRLRHWPLCGASALGLAALTLGLYSALGDSGRGIAKGPYLALTLTAMVFAAAAAWLWRGAPAARERALAVAAGAVPALALGAGLIGLHWGGPAAGGAMLWPALLAALVVLSNRLPQRPLWRLSRGVVATASLSAILLAMVIPVASSYYLGSRFSTVSSDFELRLRHWSEALDMMGTDWRSTVFGAGLGRYPDTYFWRNAQGENPGAFRYETDTQGNQFLRLAAPRRANNAGEVLRTLQHVPIEPGQRYRLAFDQRLPPAGAWLQIDLCERWLLYPQNCLEPQLPKPRPGDGWQHVELELASGQLGGGGLLHAPVQLQLANASTNTVADVDNLSLRRVGGGPELLRNGDFSAGKDYWFFSSDRDHMPWHVKNFFVNTYFEQGLLGAFAMALLLLYTVGNLAGRGWHGDLTASMTLAALAGMLVVGMFDSLFDVPRLTLLFYLLIGTGLLRARPLPRARTAQRRRRSSHASVSEALTD